VKIGSYPDDFARLLVMEKDVRRFKSILQKLQTATVPEASTQ